MSPNDADRMANSVDPDQTAPDLGLQCLPRHICLKTYDHYGIFRISFLVYNFVSHKNTSEAFHSQSGNYFSRIW